MSNAPPALLATVFLKTSHANAGALGLHVHAWHGVVQEMLRHGDTCTFTIVAQVGSGGEKPMAAVRFTDKLRQALESEMLHRPARANIRRKPNPPRMSREMVLARMRTVLDRLDSRHTHVAVARELGVSANRIRQLRDKALQLRKLGRL